RRDRELLTQEPKLLDPGAAAGRRRLVDARHCGGVEVLVEQEDATAIFLHEPERAIRQLERVDGLKRVVGTGYRGARTGHAEFVCSEIVSSHGCFPCSNVRSREPSQFRLT